MQILLSGQWKLKGNGYELIGHVPGDVTNDFLLAGLISDPYYDDNYKDSLWITKKNWTYEKEFTINELPKEDAILHFDGIDTFAEIFLNGELLGKTENMHRTYDFEVSQLLKEGNNILSVNLSSVCEKINEEKQTKYESIFCENRIFVRKAQCHFGWDWAPKFSGYGIYRDVYLRFESVETIENVHIDTDIWGNATFRIGCKENFEGEFQISILFGGIKIAETKKIVDCKKCLINLHIDGAKLWWPNGYGKQPLYEYVIRQTRKTGEEICLRRGKLAFRSVELSTSVIDEDNLDFAIKINERKVFCRGSNWVPADCMTGRVTDEKYKALVMTAKNANMNMLRVWGGGIYEKDCFYEYCDEMGIMVWQEFMFACSEIPEDNPEFLDEIKEEAILQVRRLQSHPSIVLWCGMNEIRGAFSKLEEHYSIYTLHYLLRGVVAEESPSTPYIRCSPYAFADTENDSCEGDKHDNLSERCLYGAAFKGFDKFTYDEQQEGELRRERIKNYERYLSDEYCNFLSECAVLGMCNYETLEKFAPESKLTLDSAFLTDRFLGNPYTYVMPTFFERQKVLAEGMYGKLTSVKDLAKKIGRSQADIMETEILFARTNGRTNGFLNWMYNDIWPTGTWAVVDYYLTKKPAYYAMKRCFAPVIVAILRIKDKYFLVACNDKKMAIKFEGKIVLKDYSGKDIGKEQTFSKTLAKDEKFKIEITNIQNGSFYISAKGVIGKDNFTATYDLGRYAERNEVLKYTYRVEKTGKNEIGIAIQTKTYVPCIKLWAGENAEYEDNYFNMGAGEEKHVRIRMKENLENITVCSFADEWDK